MLKKTIPLILTLILSLYATKRYALDINKIQLPEMGDSSGTLISPAQEQALGAAFFRSVQSKTKINKDVEIQQYIESIGSQLVANSDTPAYPFHFFVVLDKQINAFAGPGGYIGINSGLFLLTESESELASVMAHEVAHITQRHLYRAFEAASKLSIPIAATTLAAILLGTQSPVLAQAAIIAIQAGRLQFQIDFTRDNEKEADSIGMQTLVNSRYNPRSMSVFFERLEKSTRYYGRDTPQFLRTHPISSSRISATRNRSYQYPYRQYPDSQAYLLSKAKLRVMTNNDKKNSLKYFKLRASQGTKNQQAIARYGIGLINLKNQKFSAAEKIFQALTKQYPNQPQYVFALAKTAISGQNYPVALKLFEQANVRFPTNHAMKIGYILMLLKADKPRKAKSILETLDYRWKQRPFYFELLAQAYAKLKQTVESHRYLAEYYYAMGDTQKAILQIKLAKKAKGMNFYLQAILNERLTLFLNEEKIRKLN